MITYSDLDTGDFFIIDWHSKPNELCNLIFVKIPLIEKKYGDYNCIAIGPKHSAGIPFFIPDRDQVVRKLEINEVENEIKRIELEENEEYNILSDKDQVSLSMDIVSDKDQVSTFRRKLEENK